jgi:restriction system protein
MTKRESAFAQSYPGHHKTAADRLPTPDRAPGGLRRPPLQDTREAVERRCAAEDPRYAVQRRMAEAEFRTEAVRARVLGFERLLRDRKRGLAARRGELVDLLGRHGPEAFGAALRHALTASLRAESLPGPAAVGYLPETRGLEVGYELPRPDVVPDAAGYRYVPAEGRVCAEPREPAEIAATYRALIARLTLRPWVEIFDLAPPELVTGIVFRGYLPAPERGVGPAMRRLIVTISVNRASLAATSPERFDLDPVGELRDRLGGRLVEPPARR